MGEIDLFTVGLVIFTSIVAEILIDRGTRELNISWRAIRRVSTDPFDLRSNEMVVPWLEHGSQGPEAQP